MTTHTLRRWGAVLLTGGLLMTAAYLIYPSTAHSSLIRPAAVLGLVGILLALPALVAFQKAQSARAAVTGWVGAAMLCLGLAMLEIAHLVRGAFNPSSLYDLDAYHASLWGELEFPGVICLSVGLVVLAVATRRSGTYPRWTVWAFVANVAIGLVGSFVEPVSDALRTPAPNYLLMSLIGLAMIQLAGERSEAGSTPAAGTDRRDQAISATL